VTTQSPHITTHHTTSCDSHHQSSVTTQSPHITTHHTTTCDSHHQSSVTTQSPHITTHHTTSCDSHHQSSDSHPVMTASQSINQPTNTHIYTVGHKKTCHFILDYNFGVSWWISTLCVPT